MENKEIIRALRTTASFMEILGENAFKIRAVNNAIFNLERLEQRLAELSAEEIQAIDGVGKSIAAQISELISQGTSGELQRLMNGIPDGVRELQGIGGLGAKKIRQLWQELGIDSITALSEAIENGTLVKVKGFGAKTIKQISDAIAFREENAGKVLLPDALTMAELIHQLLDTMGIRHEESGQLRRREPVIDELVYVVEKNPRLEDLLAGSEFFELEEEFSSPFNLRGKIRQHPLPIRFRLCSPARWGNEQLTQTGPAQYLHESGLQEVIAGRQYASETEVYKANNLAYLPAEVRGSGIDELKKPLIETGDIRGILHAHSTYSDGQNTLTEMIDACIARGYEYFGITDHSRSSYFYANGLFENRVMDQFAEIAELRKKYPEFTIFSGIECDILSDGGLDYADDILSQFDFIIASVHSVLQMDSQTATRRLIRAIENPYTTILGHLTGRLLLRREGYPLNMPMILDACAANQVSIELNANPRRLDIDYRYLQDVQSRGIMISINPDAHSIEGMDDVTFGVQMARKGGLTAKENLTCLPAPELAEYFNKRRLNRTKV